jgi:hypothetical protein
LWPWRRHWSRRCRGWRHGRAYPRPGRTAAVVTVDAASGFAHAAFDAGRDALVAAARRTREAGYRKMDAYSPFPIEELSEVLGHHHDVPGSQRLGGVGPLLRVSGKGQLLGRNRAVVVFAVLPGIGGQVHEHPDFEVHPGQLRGGGQRDLRPRLRQAGQARGGQQQRRAERGEEFPSLHGPMIVAASVVRKR